MDLERWTAVDHFIEERFIGSDPALDAALRASRDADLPNIQVSPAQGKMLHLMARAMGARHILEIGTLGAYSTIWLARALPDGGRLITLEAEPKHAEVARANLARAGLSEVVELRLGRASETFPQLLAEKRGPFDFIFIDADKPGYTEYLGWSLKLSRPGTMIVGDNVVRKGAVADAASDDIKVRGVRQFLDVLAAEPRVSATVVQTVGAKGYDGFALGVVK